MTAKKLFISHSSKDKPLVDKFVDLILDTGCGLSRDQIFYTSDPDLGIKPGKDFVDHIKLHLQDSPLVVLVVSPNFYNSVFCLGELGATWALDIEIYPLIVPDVKLEDVGDLLQVIHMGMINDKSYLDRLRDVIVDAYKIPRPKTATWNLKCDQFLREFPELLKQLPHPQIVQQAVYRELQETYEEALEQMQNNEGEISNLKSMIERLKKLKDVHEVNDILFNDLPQTEQFQELIEESKSALSFLPSIVRKALFHKQIKAYFKPQNDLYNGVRDLDEAVQAQYDGYLKQGDGIFEGPFVLNHHDPSVEKSYKAIKKLKSFFETIESNSPFDQEFRDRYLMNLHECLENERFWREFLY